MVQGSRLVPGRLQAAMVLLESLRGRLDFELSKHTVVGGAGVRSHESLAEAALQRFGLDAVNRNSGRRSSNLPLWGQPLLEAMRTAKVTAQSQEPLDRVQKWLADRLRTVLETEPIEVRLEGRSAEAVVAELLRQADQRGRVGAVAQYLVGSKLKLRFPGVDVPVLPYNKGNLGQRQADFHIGEAAIEVALGTPDEAHLHQVRAILDESRTEVWLLVRASRLVGCDLLPVNRSSRYERLPGRKAQKESLDERSRKAEAAQPRADHRQAA
ncbi:hypothetical protein PHYC_03972 [Phycisphaerales bacterium]|nr:hypothetical protein PHYC_03972 [Phycisphaerales bacterium]